MNGLSRRWNADATDAAVAAITAIAAVASLALSVEPGARHPGPWAYALLAVAAAPLAVRRRMPAVMVASCSTATLVYFAADFPGGPPTIVMLVALYSVAAAGYRWWTLGVTLLFAGGGLLFRSLVENDPPVEIALNSGLYVLASLLGDAVHSRRKLSAETQERIRLARAERDAETQRRLASDRIMIARELHDVMAHTVTTMSVQAAAAEDLLDDRPEEAREALHVARSVARDAMRELRATVSVLRSSESDVLPRSPSPTLRDVPEVAETGRRSGLDVTVRRDGTPREVSGAVELTAYRVLQEALTNVMRHAHATQATLTIRYSDRHMSVQVDDDGRGPPPDMRHGYGLQGLMERVQALRGTLYAGPSPSGGFRVRADLPTEPDL